MKKLETLARCGVLVAGSGSAGAVAAISAARLGADVLLVERYGFLGGTSTAVLDTFYGFYTPGSKARQVVGGVPDDVVRGLKAHQACFERPNTYGAGTGVTYHPEYLKVVWQDLVRRAGARVLLHAWVQGVELRSGRIQAAVVATKKGLCRIEAKSFLDATGDADISFFSGVPYELAGEREPAQTLTTTFKMVNVDLARRQALPRERFHELMARAASSGRYDLPRREGSDHATPVPGMTATIMTRIRPTARRRGRIVNAADPEFLTQAEIEGRRQALEYVRFLRDLVPGYEQAHLASFGVKIGIRETRRIYGEYRLTRSDVLRARQFDDQIGLCGAPLEDHRSGPDTKWRYLPDGQCVGIPYRTLIPKNRDNLLVAGRCFSATHDAHASVRSMAQCMAMGQAAGTAAALALRRRIPPKELPPRVLRDRLRKDGAILD